MPTNPVKGVKCPKLDSYEGKTPHSTTKTPGSSLRPWLGSLDISVSLAFLALTTVRCRRKRKGRRSREPNRVILFWYITYKS